MNEDFENSIRNKLNEADIPFDQEAWSKMESLLDAGDNNKRPAAWWWWLLLVPVLSGIGWWITQPSDTQLAISRETISNQKSTTDEALHRTAEQPQNAAKNNAVSPPVATTEGANGHVTPSATYPQETTKRRANQEVLTTGDHLPETTAANTIQQTTTDDHLPKTTTANTIQQTATGGHLPKTTAANTIQQITTGDQPSKATTDNSLPGKSINTVPLAATPPGKPPAVSNASADTFSRATIDLINIKSANNYYGYTKINEPSEISVNKEIQPDQHKKNERRKINSKGLYLGVTIGPDLNVAPSFNYGNVGFNAGVLAHYYFNQHWFVTTGVVYSKKLYGATDKDYNIPGNATSYGLVKVNANCDVLDIPLNVNYTFLQVNNNTLSATLGLSNYIMLKEKYQYIYKSSPEWEKTVENQNQHYLAILNVGALYQHPAGKRLIIGVQPYAKIPLHGVGLGQVKLYSAGLALQLNLVGKKRR